MSVLEGTMRNVTHTTVLSLIAYASAIGCDSGAPRKEEVFFVLESNASNEKHTLCGSCSQPWCEGPETYSFPLMNEKLRKYPVFAHAIGMGSVSTCDEAREFMAAYYRYVQKHPAFDDDLPRKAELYRDWIKNGVHDP